jgi:hypothetical protein
MSHAHLSLRWREAVPPLQVNLDCTSVSNGVVRVGDWVRELPAPHHIQPCACVLCRELPEEDRVVQVQGIGERAGTSYVLLPDGYECPAVELERVGRSA